MLDIWMNERGEVVLAGRFDAAQVERAKAVLDQVTGTTYVDFKELSYISSAGLGILMATQKRLKDAGYELKLRNVSGHIRDVFQIARFELIFTIE
jgi:anti-sigma B factor antagonist